LNRIVSERLELVSMSGEFVDALLAGRRREAESILALKLPKDWPDNHDRGFLDLRLRELRDRPEAEYWLVYALVLPDRDRPMVGHAGFHGPPGRNALNAPDAVELGYTIFPPYRRRGLAGEAVRALIDWAAAEQDIRHFVASIGPQNEPSLAIVRRLGFQETGRHWDEEDGEELEFELRLSGAV
jgi:RimJ/RimL family protein N-acetyltransferase